MANYRVQCINKQPRNNTHEGITHLGGTAPDGSSWKDTRRNVVQFIESKTHTFYTLVNNKRADVFVVKENGKDPYLRTASDGYYNNNLLELVECV